MRYWHQLPRVFDSIRTVTFLQPTERFKQMNCTLIMIINELKVTPSAKSLAFSKSSPSRKIPDIKISFLLTHIIFSVILN